MNNDSPVVDNGDEQTGEEQKSDDWYRKRARELYSLNGEIEVDSNAIISRGDDPGAFVAAWVWVPDHEKLAED